GFHNLKSTYGTFSCAGNHDEWLGMDLISEAMQQHDLGLLRNETKVLNIDGASLNVIGIDYTRGNEFFLTSALETSAHEGFNLLLCHHPEFFPVAKSNHIDLMLAGHTHGGQIALDVAGVSLYPIDFIYHYSRGLYEEAGKKLYVNYGVGVTGTPIRTIEPEIVLITLT
ncbi:MAG: hypothetical protein IAF08_00350, partial [Rhizobacter sp.]|nr:hypothetical protein [Chlorobiales bacterium]